MQYFKNKCKGKEPSIGYTILCLMARAGLLRLVFTTNFDRLTVKAASQTRVLLIEISLENPKAIYRTSSRDELQYVELHGDYRYEKLKNTRKELDNQQDDFVKALVHHLRDKHLIVLGYSGRDNSLMKSLEKAYQEEGEGILYWCGYSDIIPKKVEQLIRSIKESGRSAYYISTGDFDQSLMDVAKYCFNDKEEFQNILNQSKIVDSDDFKVSSIAEEVGLESIETSFIDIDEEECVPKVNVVQPYTSDLIIPCIVGSWDEDSTSDKEIIGQMVREEYRDWIPKLRNILPSPESPISFQNGKWTVMDRKALLRVIGSRIFNDNLDNFKECIVAVLTERNPMFDLPPENRFAANVYGKVLKHSKYLRKGLSEGLALLGSHPNALSHCSSNKVKTITVLAVREIFENADWVLWASLGDLLPLIAEAAPEEFIKSVERALLQTPCPFDELYSQEGSGVYGRNYLTGLLWALETLAWDKQLLNRISLILGELASHDPGGNWGNRPLNSLTTIFLPWLPQTTASIKKRNVAVTTLQREFPEVAWKLLLSLLPKQHQTSSGSRKPIWREIIPEDWSNEVTKKEYWEQVSFYADLAVEIAIDDTGKLKELISYFDNLPEKALEKVLEHLSSEDISARDESELLGIWNELTEFVLWHKRYADPKKHLSPKIVSRIEKIATQYAPTNPLNLHRRLFNGRSFDPYETKGNWQEQYQQLEEKCQGAIKEILDLGGIDAVFQFAESVESLSDLGNSLGHVAGSSIDASLFPNLLDTRKNKFTQLVEGYVRGQYYGKGWIWVDSLDRSEWSTEQIGQFLAYLPFSAETWERVETLLGDSENEYWQRVEVKPFQADRNIALAIDKLNEFGKPMSAINCLYRVLHDKKPLDITQSIKILLSATKSRERLQSQDAFHIARIIKSLQENEKVNPNDLLVVEWTYLPLLDGRHDVTPIVLENRMTNNPDYFCKIIRLVYRSQFETEVKKELSKEEQTMAINAGRLIRMWKTPPGMDTNGGFIDSRFKLWLEFVKRVCGETGHLKVALEHVGEVLINTPPDPDGLWIHQAVAEELNKIDSEDMRRGYKVGKYNSRGAHVVDPTGKKDNKIANEYRTLADDVDNAGYPRFAGTLRALADDIDSEVHTFATIMEDYTEGTE